MGYLKKIDGGRILDVACGGGHTAQEVCRELKSWDHVTGVDLRQSLREPFLEKFPEGRATFIAGDVRDLLEGEHEFDTILLGFSLHHLPRGSELMGRLADLTPDQSRLIVLEMFCDDLSPAQEIQRRVHELAGKMDRLRGEYHAPVFSREQIDTSVIESGRWDIVHTEDDRNENLTHDLYKISQTGEKLRHIATATYPEGIPGEISEKIDRVMADAEQVGMSSPPFRMIVAVKG